MESALLSSASSVSSIPAVARLQCGLSIARMSRLHVSRCGELSRPGLSSMARRAGYLEVQRKKLQFTARSAAGGGGGGGGDGAAEGVESKPASVSDDPALSSEVIVLDVGGMTCGGCAESVRKILESQPQVSSASVNLTAETAVVRPVSEAKAAPNWQKDIGEALAKHLTNCGFKSNFKDQGVVDENIQA